MSETQDPKVMIFEKGRLTELVVDEPASTFGGLTPPVTLPVAPSFVDLATLSIFVNDTTDKVWLNATVGWLASFTVIGEVTATFQILKGGVVVYETTQTVSSTLTIAVPPFAAYNIVHLEHIDTTPVPLPSKVTYSLRAQANIAGASTSGPVTLTAAKIKRNAIA
ncbi:MAG: hypothetical protein PWQ97_906 [Tepidanaerobacteraceae bacterium]|nr:hypothetical protein [Tepidanaerobacteraceae bacterium]